MSTNMTTMNRRTFTKSLAALGAASLAGAFVGEGTGTQVAKADENKPDTLTIYIGGTGADGFDPLAGYWGYNGSTILFQSRLFTYDKDLNLTPDLATGVEVSDDLLTYTYKLREGVKFSDGSDFTANDVVFSYLTARDNGTCVIDLTSIADVTAPDDHTVVFTLNKPNSSFHYIAGKLGIVPAASYDPESYRLNPVGTGPFRLLQWDPSQQMIIEPNEYYYGTQSSFKRITFVFIDTETALANAMSGQYDVVMVNPEYALEQVDGMSLQTFRTIDTRGFNLPCSPATQGEDGKTVGNDVTCHPEIRQALNIGVSRQAIVDNALNGIGTASTTLLQFVPWANTDIQFEDGRVDEAKAMLEDAGWVMGGDGVYAKDGLRASFTITGRTDDLQRYNIAIAFAQEAAKLGIEIKANSASWAECKEYAKNIPTCYGTGDYDPAGDLSNYYGAGNLAQYDNATVQAHIQDALDAPTTEEANEHWKLVQWDGATGPEGETGDVPDIWLVTIDHVYFVRDGLNLGEQPVHPHGHGFPVAHNLNEWHWD